MTTHELIGSSPRFQGVRGPARKRVVRTRAWSVYRGLHADHRALSGRRPRHALPGRNRGDLSFLYTDGIYDDRDEKERLDLEELMRDVCRRSASEICRAGVQS